jgi:predicted transcriptional regulator
LAYGEIIPLEQRPLIVELTADAIMRLAEVSGDFRRSEAKALYAEGHTMEAIATMFGVTRQRVSSLLRDE